MSAGPYPFTKLSVEAAKDVKLIKVYQQLKKKLSSKKKPKSPTNVTERSEKETEEVKTEQRIVELIWEGDVEDRINLLLPHTITVEECKDSLFKGLGVPDKNITLINDGQKLKPKDEIHGGAAAKIIVEFALDDNEIETEIVPVAPQVNNSRSEVEPSGSETPDVQVQKVMMKVPDGHKRYIEVAVMKEHHPREYFGGYRNKQTGQVYYNAQVQTLYRACAEHNLTQATESLKLSQKNRSTQTLLPLIDEGVNTMAEKCVQMSGTGLYIPAITDKIITARPYHEYNMVHKRMSPYEAVLILQRAWRHYINMKKISQKYKSIFDERMAKMQFKGSSMVEFHKQQLALLTNDSFPTSRSDFYDLYTVLGDWMTKHKKNLTRHKSSFAYKVAMADLQKEQTRGLLAIEGHRIQAKRENLQKQDIMFLEGTARSRVRTYPKGNRTFIDDLNIKRARDIKEMYASYTRTDVTDAERIEILTGIRDCLLGFETVDLTEDLTEILEREIDFITMGIKKENMEYLKRRFESLFIDFAKKPEFNPQAKYYKKSSMSQKKYAMHRCSSCNKVFNTSQMFTHLRLSRFRVCTSCSYMHTTATASINLAPYKRLLESLRAAETEKGCRSAIPFLLQPMGMYFLVNILWDGRSIISESSYLPGLRVTRWMPNEQWSMWNMILLTELEAHKHEKLGNPLDYYSKEFVLNVMNRNILGRIHFRMVADIDAKFRTREQIGILPKDHFLYTTKKISAALPQNNPHLFLVPTKATYGRKKKTVTVGV